ncbi:MAG: cellulase family glycosylhydrolase, partial [Solirubrobacteraceae bacterium]
MDRSLRRGISLGGTLDGGELELDDGWFDAIRDAGLDLVRLPVRWDTVAHERVDRAVEGGLARGLAVVLDVHHFEGSDAAFLALWERIAARYAGADPRL